jgi:hypothetical protein
MSISPKRSVYPGFVAATFVVASMFIALPGHAARRHTVNAGSPKPEICKNYGTIPNGTWLLSKPCGYYIGRALTGSSFDNHDNSDANFHYGRSHGNNNFCAWIPPGALGGETEEVPDSCGADTREALTHRQTFGKNFNAAPGAEDGSAAFVDANCPAHYNYFDSSNFGSGVLRDEAGALGVGQVQYRYTTRDGAAMVVRHPDEAIGWVFVPSSCFQGPVDGWPFNNDPD